jgi:probable rRNA maturation factor
LSGSLYIRNQQRALPLNVRYLRQLAQKLFDELLEVTQFDLGIYVVRTRTMSRLNETHLRHKGSTDVITFDYSERPKSRSSREAHLHGEIFICIDEAVIQATRFRTTWQSEVMRYLIHGVLHLKGYDDLKPASRRAMKLQENRLLRAIALRFPLRKLSAGSKISV